MPIVRTYDAAFQQELADHIDYEFWLLDHFRTRFFNQAESPNGSTTFTLGHRAENGELLGHMQMTLVSSLSEHAVKETLGKFRLLALTSAFKLQDMAAEWILDANGENNWRFAAKLQAYDRLRAAGDLHEPPALAARPDLSRAFWELYRAMEPPRGAVIHTGNVVSHANGDLEIRDRHGRTHVFDLACQAAYVRACWLLVAVLTGRRSLNGFEQAVLENDIAALSVVHGVPGFAARSIRFEHLRVNVPLSFAATTSPYSCEVDMAELISRMAQSHPVGPGGTLYLSVEVVAAAEGRTLVWSLPPERVPADRLSLREDDPDLGQYLDITVP